MPPEFYELPTEMRQSVCTVVARLEKAGEKATNRRVRAELKKANGMGYEAKRLAALLRWHNQGLLPNRWDGTPDGASNEGLAARRQLPTQPPAQQRALRAAAKQALPAAGSEELEEHLAALRLSLAELSDPPYTEARLLDYTAAAKKLLSLGAMSASESAQHGSWVDKGRKLMEAERDAPTDDPENVFPLTAEGYAVANDFERICGERRRRLAAEYVAWLLAIDFLELPAYDPQGAI